VCKAVAVGQVLAVCNAGTGVTSQLITNNYKLKIPTTQSFLTYLTLCTTYGVYQIFNNGFTLLFSRTGLLCLFLAGSDFLATYLTVTAYQYTSLVSIQLLDCMTIPTIMLLSWLFLKQRYKLGQYGAVLVCFGGVGLMLFEDTGTQSVKGDVLCTIGAVLYGINNVCVEWVARDIGTYGYLGTYCWFAFVISGVQMVVVEREEIRSIPWNDMNIYLIVIAFVIFLFVFLTIMPWMLVTYHATVANLNLLAADVYSAICGVLIFKMKFSYLYVISFLLIFGGVLGYTVVDYYADRAKVKVERDQREAEGTEDANDLESSGLLENEVGRSNMGAIVS